MASIVALATGLSVSPRHRPERLAIPEPPPLVEPAPPREAVRAAFFTAQVEPVIAETDSLNREAADRCMLRLRQLISGYRSGVDPFVDDLTSVSTRLGIVRRMPGGWWRGDDRVERYVRSKFERHLFSDTKLKYDVATILRQFHGEVDANQKRMLVSVSASLNEADLPEVNVGRYETFFESVADRLQQYSTDQGTTTVFNGLTVLLASEVGSYAAVTVVGGLLARFGSSAAVGAAAGAGATAGATAAGAGGGSFAGPVGTVVGIGVGLVAGLAIDWWMTEKFEAQMGSEMERYLVGIENALLHGNASGRRPAATPATTPTAGGLADALPQVCDRLADAYRESFFEKIVLAEST